MLNAILTCTHRIIKVINKSGFICVALKSQYFCLSCLEGMTLILRNPIKFGMISIFGEIFVFVGKLFVASITSFVGYMVITQFSPYTETLNTPYLPTMVRDPPLTPGLLLQRTRGGQHLHVDLRPLCGHHHVLFLR